MLLKLDGPVSSAAKTIATVVVAGRPFATWAVRCGRRCEAAPFQPHFRCGRGCPRSI